MILESGHRVRAETHGDQTSLTIEVTEREDSGNYKIVLQNEAGEDTASVKIKVVGKSSQNSCGQLRIFFFLSLVMAILSRLQTSLMLQRLLWSLKWAVIGAL